MDTIAAIATPAGRGGVGIVRISGVNAVQVSQRLVKGTFPKPRRAAYRVLVDMDHAVLDQGLVIFYPAPHSFTGEDVVELQGHGSPAVLNALLANLRKQGVRDARPGEFSKRAFLNNRIDLTQAEAIADLIDADSFEAAQAAVRSLQGVFSDKVHAIHKTFVKIRGEIEADIDFSDEDIEPLSRKRLQNNLTQCAQDLSELIKASRQGLRLQQGVRLVIAGKPNAGKSSLLNALSGQDVAIVSRIAGTTRDIVTANFVLDGLPLHILDTAGLHVTQNEIEQEGIKRAMAAIQQADQVLWVIDGTAVPYEKTTDVLPPTLISNSRVIIIRNKSDLSHEVVGVKRVGGRDVITLSATTADGLLEFKNYLKEKVEYNSQYVSFSARERHVVALTRALKHLDEAIQTPHDLEVVSLLLKEAHQAVGEITGVFTTEDLLGQIFSSFCIGK